jgi:hypothetical protein
MSRGQSAAGLALLGVVATIACFFLFAGVYVAGRSTTARVVRVEWSGAGSSRDCRPVLSYEVNGEAYERPSRIATGTCPFAVGESVRVYYWADRPGDPSPVSVGAFLPLLFPMFLFVAAAGQALRKPKASERLEAARAGSVAQAADGELLKVRGRLAPAPGAAPIVAPLTGRACVAAWTRVVRRDPGARDRKIFDDARVTAFVVRAADGEVRVAADAPVKLLVDADARGDTEVERSAPLEALLAAYGHSGDDANTAAHHFIWYQGVFAADEEVVVLGRARRVGPGAVALEGRKDDPVVLEHVDRDARKRAIPRG